MSDTQRALTRLLISTINAREVEAARISRTLHDEVGQDRLIDGRGMLGTDPSGDQEWLDQVMAYLEGDRDFLMQYLNENIPAIRMCTTEAT